jgi:L-ascorbate metabolism protein UlaG (beta-lactamase superfamily)
MTVRLTHLGHACVLVDLDGTRLLIDPGTLSSGFDQLEDLDAVLLTHAHDDHVDLERLRPLLARNPGAVLLTDHELPDALGLDRAIPMRPGDARDVNGISVRATGGAHARVWRDVPAMANIGFLLDEGVLLHPGDGLDRPDVPVDVLLVPVSGPWIRIGEAADLLHAVRPRVAVPIHEAALSSAEQAYGMLADFAPEGTAVRPLSRAVATTV